MSSDFVDEWAAKYRADMPDEERVLFSEVGPATQERGFLTREDFIRIGRWKSRRKSKVLESVPDDVVKQVSHAAFAVEEERISVLAALPGVQQGRASAILTVWNPARYTIIDWRAVQSLKAAGVFDDWKTDPPYGAYLLACRSLASRLTLRHVDVTPLRELDRALWKYSEMQPSGE